MRHVILALLAMTGLACSEKASPIVGETFVWPPTAAVEGRVVSHSGAGIGNATITVTALRPRPTFSVGIPSVSDADGYFKLTVSSETGVDSASLQFATQRPGGGPADRYGVAAVWSDKLEYSFTSGEQVRPEVARAVGSVCLG